MFARLGEGATLVLDNFQDTDGDESWHGALAEAFVEVPDGANVMVLSRADPPALYIRLRANRRMALIGWDALKLTPEETRAIALTDGRRSDVEIDALHLRCSGWAAGLTLLLECLHRGNILEAIDQRENLQDVFDYFAAEVFQAAPEEAQQTLLSIACLPRMSSDIAIALSGSTGAGQLLDNLYRRHLFTDRRWPDASTSAAPRPFQGNETRAGNYVYQFHALFRAFLRYRAEQTLPGERRKQLAQHAATLLEGRGHVDDAMDLFCEALDRDGAVALILRNAAALYRQGRWETLLDWIDKLPPTLLAANPWVLFWKGMGVAVLLPAVGRNILEQSIQIFEAQDNQEGQLLCMAEIVRSHYFESFARDQMGLWLNRMKAIQQSGFCFTSPGAELSVLSTSLIGNGYTFGSKEYAEPTARRVMQLIEHASIDAGEKLVAAIFTLWWFNITGQFVLSAHITRLGDELLDSSEVSDLMRASWYSPRAWWQAFSEHALAEQSYARAVDIARGNNFAHAEYMARHLSVYFHTMWNEIQEAEAMLEQTQRLIRHSGSALPVGAFHEGTVHLCCVFVYKAKGDIERTLHYAKLAWTAIRGTPSVYLIAVWGSILADAFTVGSQYDRAQEVIDEARTAKQGTCFDCLDASLLLQESFIAFHRRNFEKAKSILASALSLARANPHQQPFLRWILVGEPIALFALAMEHGIEVEFVRARIQDWHLPAPPAANMRWAWRLKVFTLGEFTIVRDGASITFARKAPKRLLQLLQCLIAMGSVNVPVEILIDSLWADLEGDAAHEALGVAIRRLRKLLGAQNLLRLHNGTLTLDLRYVWIDVIAFEGLLGSIRPNTAMDMDAMFTLYRGAFLAGSNDPPWVAATRTRLRRKFVDCVRMSAHERESSDRWDRAQGLYQRAIDVDPLADSLQRDLTRCRQALEARKPGSELRKLPSPG